MFFILCIQKGEAVLEPQNCFVVVWVCTASSLKCQQMVFVLVPRWDVLVVWSCQPRTKLCGECRLLDMWVCKIFDLLNY